MQCRTLSVDLGLKYCFQVAEPAGSVQGGNMNIAEEQQHSTLSRSNLRHNGADLSFWPDARALCPYSHYLTNMQKVF